MSDLEKQRLARERAKVVQEQTQPTTGIKTGAEQVDQPKSSDMKENKVMSTKREAFDKMRKSGRKSWTEKDQAEVAKADIKIDAEKAKLLDVSGQTAREQTAIRAPQALTIPRTKGVKPILPSQRDVKTFDKTIQEFYDKSNFPSQETLREAYLKAGPNEIDSVSFPPKNIEETLYRLAYGASEIVGGGVREATFGYSGGLGVEARPGGQVAQITGALLTPTVADMIFSEVLTRVIKTVKGQRIIAKILNKIDDTANSMIDLKHGTRAMDQAVQQFPVGDEWANAAQLRNLPKAQKTSYDTAEMYARWMKVKDTLDPKDLKSMKLTKDDLRILEKIRIGDTPSTSDMRNAKKVFNKLEAGFTKIDDPLGTLTEHELYYIRQEAKKLKIKDLNELLDKTTNPKEKLQIVVDFVTKNPELARTSEVITDIPLNQFDDPYEIRDIIDFTKENKDLFIDGRILSTLITTNLSKKDAKKLLEETTELSKTEINNIIEQLRKPAPKPTEDDITDIVPVDDTEEGTPVPPIEKQDPVPDQPDPTKPEPPEEIQEPVPEPPEVIPDEEPIQDEPTQTPPLRLTIKQREARRKLNLQLFSGKKQLYRVNYQYKGGRKETIGPLEARSLPDALGKAQRIRSGNKTLPTVIKVTFIGEKRK